MESGRRSQRLRRRLRRLPNRPAIHREGRLDRAAELANVADLRLTAPKPVALPKDSQIIRVYKGEEIVVDVTDNGFEWNNEKYKSLSAVAKAVTGSHWSGNRFFGLQGGAK